jgi:hypothetical protein
VKFDAAIVVDAASLRSMFLLSIDSFAETDFVATPQLLQRR